MKDPYEYFRGLIRERGLQVTPWRLGREIGKHGAVLTAPAQYTEQSRDLYNKGWEEGLYRSPPALKPNAST